MVFLLDGCSRHDGEEDHKGEKDPRKREHHNVYGSFFCFLSR